MYWLSTAPLAKRALLECMMSFCRSGFCVQCMGFLLVLLTRTRGHSCRFSGAGQASAGAVCHPVPVALARSVSVCVARTGCHICVARTGCHICVARTGCHPFSLYLCGQNGVPSVQSLSEWPERGAIRLVSICVARTGCHPFGLFGQNRVPTVQSLSVGSLLTAE